MKTRRMLPLLFVLTIAFTAFTQTIVCPPDALASGALSAAPAVTIETGNGAEWKFPTIPRPSRSDIARDAKVTLVGNEPATSCLPPDGLHNGVLPWEGKETRNFFALSNFNTKNGTLVMDLGKVQPVAALAAYSWQAAYPGSATGGSFRGTGPDRIPHDGVNGARAPQVYTLYASAAEKPDAANLTGVDWVKLADVDTRPNRTGKNWAGQYGSFIRDAKGGLLGNFRWLAWEIKPTAKPGQIPEWSDTWYTELDVHTPATLKTAGDAVMAGSEVEEIVLSFKTHFDIGFTHPAPEIVNIYRTRMIDGALKLIEASQKLPPNQRFSWTIPSWVMWQLLWPGQDPVRKARILRAVKNGGLVVHALPVTMHTESLDLPDLVAGLNIHSRIAKELGIPLSRAGKMTDVPSHSRVLPTLLKNAGIDFLHIGVNVCNMRPDLPLLYQWEGPDGSRLLTFHNQGYGTELQIGRGLYPPKDWPYKHWLALIMTGDNGGPPTQAAVQKLLGEGARNLPKVKIRLGKMEDFADGILAEEKAGAIIPVVRADQPDRWIHGMGTMPVLEALAHQTRPGLVAAESLDTHLRAWGLPRPDIRADLFTAHERSLMYGEHTWGGSKNLEHRNAYTMKNFAQFVKTDPDCKWLQRTWDDHADYMNKATAITGKLTADGMAQLAAAVNLEGDRLVVFNPLPYTRDALVEIPGKPGQTILVKDLPPSGYKAVKLDRSDRMDQSDQSDQAVLENAFLKVTLDRARGGIVSIVDKATGRELVDPKAKYAFGQYLYQRFDRQQTRAYDMGIGNMDALCGLATGWNVRADHPAGVPYAEAVPAYQTMTVGKNAVAHSATLTAPAAGIIASKVTLTVTLPVDAPWLEIAVRLDDKQPDYWPENGGFYLPVNAANPQFRIGRLGGIADPTKDYARNSNNTYGYVNNGAMIAGADGQGLAIYPLDHGIMSFGDKGICMVDPDYVPRTPLAQVSIFNNIWTINFPYWISGTVQSRVRVWATHDLKPSSLIVPALAARQPALAAVASGPAGKIPVEQSGLALSRPGVRLIQFAANPEGAGTLLRVWEQAGESGELTVTLGAPAPSPAFTTATPVNLRGEPVGPTIKIIDGKFTFNLGAYAPASFILQ